MTKAKPPSEWKRTGRPPKRPEERLSELMAANVLPRVARPIRALAKARKVDVGVIVREILTAWAELQPKPAPKPKRAPRAAAKLVK